MGDLQAFETFDTAGLSSDGFPSLTSMAAFDMFKHSEKLPPHSSHPNFGHLSLLVFQAVLEVVFVALPGYIVARQGMFDANAQKFAANLNVQLFTPCLSTFPRFPITLNPALTFASLLQTLLTTAARGSPWSSTYSSHICYPDRRLVRMCQIRVVVLRLQETRTELCHCHGRTSFPCQVHSRYTPNMHRSSATLIHCPSLS
jgi:hypothetical protein